MTTILRARPAAQKLPRRETAASTATTSLKTSGHTRGEVVSARARRDEAVQKRDAKVAKAQEDGKVTRAERRGIRGAREDLQIARGDLRLQRAERALAHVSRDASADGKLDKHEEVALEAATELVGLRRKELKALLTPEKKGGPTDLVLSSFNVTGSSHTGPGSTHPELESGRKRIHYVAKLLQKHKVDVVGFQELQGDQLEELHKVTDNKYGVYPGFKLGRRESVNSIAWLKEKWELVKPDTIKIPYFNGQKREMPVVLLRNKETGQKAWFANFHNPADTKRFHNQERFRDAATRLQVALVNRLRKKTGHPVFLTGDMNESEEYYRKMTGGTEMESSHKGRNGKRPNRAGIDWIFGSKDVKFSDYNRDRSKLVRDTTNHPMVVTRARIRAGKK